MPGTPYQEKIYAIRSFGLNVITHFSNEQCDSVGKGRTAEGRQQEIVSSIAYALEPFRKRNHICAICTHFLLQHANCLRQFTLCAVQRGCRRASIGTQL